MKKFIALALIIIALCPECREAKAVAPQEMDEMMMPDNMLEEMSEGEEEDEVGMMVDGDITLSENE
jgi:hypothetical protein